MAWIRACGGGSPAVPDGRTVTPINDVTIWQQCAGIANPTYTTLAEVLADVGMLSTLMSSNNAVDYLLRSKKFIDNRLVPKMTSNTAPSGVASASSEILNHEAYTAFDRDIESIWEATTTGGTQTGYLQYDFGEPTKVAGLKLVNWSTPGTYTQTLKSITVSGSNDGNTFTTITSENVNISADKYEYTKVFNAEYNIYRVSITSTQSFSAANNPSIREVQFYSDGIGITQSADAMQYIGANNYCANTLLADSDWRSAICNSTYFESVLNVKVPKMTSDTTPSGTIVHSRTYSNYYSWYAFSNPASSTSGSNAFYSDADYEKYIGYDFGKSVKVHRIDAKYCHQAGGGTQTNSYKLQTSINGNNYDDISNSERTVTTTNPAYNDIRWSDMQTVICNVNCNIVRSIFTSGSGGCSWAYMQIYGREDV